MAIKSLCNLQLYSQIDTTVLRVYLKGTVQCDVKVSVSKMGGLGPNAVGSFQHCLLQLLSPAEKCSRVTRP